MSFTNLLFPSRNMCYLCKERTEYLLGFTCSDCREEIVYKNKEVDINSTYIDKVIYAVSYNRFIKEIVHDFKFNRKSYLYKPLAEILIKTMNALEISDIDIIMFIPIHRRKEAIRGYNQSELLAKYIAKNLDLAISKDNLIKSKWTKEQNTLNRIERLTNLKDSFIIKNPAEIHNKNILLLDDILTTGTTFEECGRLLKENGAKSVRALALTSNRN